VIVCHTYNGLANRLRVAASALILGKQLDRPVQLTWPAGQGMNCPFEELFDPSGIEFLQVPADFFVTPHLRTPRAYLPPGTLVWHDRLGNLTGERYDRVHQHPLVMTRERLKDLPETIYIRTCFAYRPESLNLGDYQQAFSETLRRRFQPRKDILDQMLNLPGNTVGIHVRLGDKQANPVLRRIKAGSMIENFYPAMDALVASEPDVRFFLCSDDDAAKAQLSARYEGRILMYPAVVQTRSSREGMRDALRDLYTLAQTRLILTDGDSSFGPLAAQYYQRSTRNMRPDFRGPGRLGTAQAALTSLLIAETQRLWQKLRGG